MPFNSGAIGRCRWSLTSGTPGEADIDGFLAHVAGLTQDPQGGIVVIDFAHDVSLPNSMQRKALSNAVEALPHKERVLAHALVTNSTAARGVLTAINWLVRERPFEERVFSEPATGLAWVLAKTNAVSAEDVLESIRAKVPDFARLRW